MCNLTLSDLEIVVQAIGAVEHHTLGGQDLGDRPLVGTLPLGLDEMPPLVYDRKVLQPLVVLLRTISYCLMGFLGPEDQADTDYYPTGQFSLSLDRPGRGREVRREGGKSIVKVPYMLHITVCS